MIVARDSFRLRSPLVSVATPGQWGQRTVFLPRAAPNVACRVRTVRKVQLRAQASLDGDVPSPEEFEKETVKSEAELAAEASLSNGGEGAIAGIPRHEWLKGVRGEIPTLVGPLAASHALNETGHVSGAGVQVGASAGGHILLYTMVNEEPSMLCDRCYFPGEDMALCLGKYGLELFALESRRALREFHTVGFSLSYELGGSSVLSMLKMANIPITWRERQEPSDRPWKVGANGSWPLIFAGGPTATSNPEPFSDFFDFFAIGDGEECLPEIGYCLQRCEEEGLSRFDTLLKLAREVKGVFVPSLYEHLPGPTPANKSVWCPTFKQPSVVVEAVESGLRKTGYTEFSLLSLSCSDYLALPAVGIQIKNRLRDVPISLSLPSQRVDRFNDDIADIIGGTRQGLTDEELLRGVKSAWDKGWRQVKLYFMIGLPGETDDDVMGIARTVKWLQHHCRRGKQRLALRLTVSNFTPKPFTPFQWHSVSTSEFVRKQEMLKRELCRSWDVKFSFSDVRVSCMEDFISRGDRSLGEVMRRAWELGATNEGWWLSPEDTFGVWSQAIEESGLGWKYRQVSDGEWNVMEKVGDASYRGQGGGGKARLDSGPGADARLDSPLPWDIIDAGVAKWWLKADLQRALESTTVPDCSHSGVCSKCGVCGDEFGDNVVADVPEVPPFEGHFKPNTDRIQRLRVRYSKVGTMALIGHLDVITLLDRALKRAALPVSYDKGFHSHPRISTAQALPLGWTSDWELADIDLTRRMEPREVESQLRAQLPSEVRVLSVEEVPIRRADGKMSESLTQLLYAAENCVAIAVNKEYCTGQVADPVSADVATWIRQVEALPSFEAKVKSKAVGSKVVDLRARLSSLHVHVGPLPASMAHSWHRPAGTSTAVLRYTGVCDPTLGTLQPAEVVQMLTAVSGEDIQVLHVHRTNLLLKEPSQPKINVLRLRSALQDEAFRALNRRYDGTSLLHGDQPEDYREAALNAKRAAASVHMV